MNFSNKFNLHEIKIKGTLKYLHCSANHWKVIYWSYYYRLVEIIYEMHILQAGTNHACTINHWKFIYCRQGAIMHVLLIIENSFTAGKEQSCMYYQSLKINLLQAGSNHACTINHWEFIYCRQGAIKHVLSIIEN